MIKTLIVDDSEKLRALLIRTVGQAFPNPSEAFEFTEAEDGGEALRIVNSSSRFDLILTDWDMPVMTGIEFLRALANPPPTVFVTSEITGGMKVLASNAGAKDVVIRPFSAEALKTVLSPIIGQRALPK